MHEFSRSLIKTLANKYNHSWFYIKKMEIVSWLGKKIFENIIKTLISYQQIYKTFLQKPIDFRYLK